MSGARLVHPTPSTRTHMHPHAPVPPAVHVDTVVAGAKPWPVAFMLPVADRVNREVTVRVTGPSTTTDPSIWAEVHVYAPPARSQDVPTGTARVLPPVLQPVQLFEEEEDKQTGSR